MPLDFFWCVERVPKWIMVWRNNMCLTEWTSEIVQLAFYHVNLCYRKLIAKARLDCDWTGGQCKVSWWDHFLLFWLKTRALHSRLWISLERNILICGINKKGLKQFLWTASLKTTLSYIGGLFKINLFSKKQQLELETVWLRLHGYICIIWKT